MNKDNYHPLPQPIEVGNGERETAMGAYLMMFASLGIGLPLPIINLVVAIIYFYINRKKSRFICFHAFQSLISQLPTSIINASALLWTMILIFGQFEPLIEDNIETEIIFPVVYMVYIGIVIVVNFIYVIFSVVAASKAYKGEFYYMIFFGRIAYNYAYKRRVGDDEIEGEIINRPPR